MRISRSWAILTAVAGAIAAVLLFAPTGTSATCGATVGEPSECTEGSTSMLSSEGVWVLVPLSLPALACLVAVVLGSRLAAQLVAAALVVFCVLTGFTIGLFFLPVALTALVLAIRGQGAAPAPAGA